MPPPLIAARRRAITVVAIALAVAVTGWLAVLAYHAGSTSFDTWALRTSLRHIGSGGAAVLLAVSEPAVSFGVIVVVVGVAALVRRWDVVAFAALGPALAVLVTEQVLKPLIGRLIGVNVIAGDLTNAYVGAFPSGHETGVTSAALVVLVALGQVRLRPAVRRGIVGVLIGWVLLAALGLVRNFYHYATDTVGGIGVSVAAVLGVALAVDQWYAPVTDRLGARRRQLT